MKKIVFICSTLLAPLFSQAQSSVELMCKAQAKETAIQVYNDCYKNNVTNKLQQIQKEYKAEQAMMKKKYQNQIDELVGKTPAQTAAKMPVAKKSASAMPQSQSQSLPQALPQKQTPGNNALPVQTITQSPEPVTETEVNTTEEPQIVDIPVQN